MRCYNVILSCADRIEVKQIKEKERTPWQAQFKFAFDSVITLIANHNSQIL